MPREQKQEKILDSLTRANAKPAYSFAFTVESYKAQYKSGGTYTSTVIEANKPTSDKRPVTYTSSENKIATVDNKGVVTFVTPGTVTITASKEAAPGLDEATASYILYLSTFAFGEASHKARFREGGTHTSAVVETHKAPDDTRAITYTSSAPAIATVDNAGEVTFVTPGKVTITASKALEGEYPKATASYTLYISNFAFGEATVESHKVAFHGCWYLLPCRRQHKQTQRRYTGYYIHLKCSCDCYGG